MLEASSAIMIRTGMLRTNEMSVADTRSASGNARQRPEQPERERRADRRREDRVEDRRVERRGLADEPRALADEQLAARRHPTPLVATVALLAVASRPAAQRLTGGAAPRR